MTKMNDMACPYCGEGVKINHDDGFGYEEDTPHETECPHCGKMFVFYTYVSYTYRPEKADCLNGGEHTYRPSVTYPRECTRMECIHCGDDRSLTEEEKHIFFAEEEVGDVLQQST